jgi:malate dehydrogenase
MYGFPVTCSNGTYKIVQGLTVTDADRKYMMDSYKELLEERELVKHLFG